MELENRMYLEGRTCNWGIPKDDELTPEEKEELELEKADRYMDERI